MTDYFELAVPGVQALQPYLPGKPISELQRELGLTHIVKLASNENPLGISPLVRDALRGAINELTRYPDGNAFELKQKLAMKYQVEKNAVTVGNGSNDILEMVARTFAQAGDEIIFSEYAFAVYPIITQAINAIAKVIPAKQWGHDLDAMADAVTEKTRIIFIANPNNPTGTWLTGTQISGFLDKIPENVIVVLDEAYFEYASHPGSGIDDFPDGIKLLGKYHNLIVSRTFSKAYGLAGLRVGYSISNDSIADLLNRVRQPFNVNALALTAAVAVLDDHEYLEKGVLINKQGMDSITATLEEMGVRYIPSAGNFISFDLKKDAMPVYNELLKKGVIVRPVANYSMPQHLRVSIGTNEENVFFLEALKQVLD